MDSMRWSRRLGTLLTACVLGVLGCAKTELREERHPATGAIRSRGSVTQDKEGNYVLTGTWTYWHANGQKEAEGEYQQGKASGERGDTGVLKDGREGLWCFWYENGTKSEESFYRAGTLNGSSTTWYKSGKKKQQGTFKDGQLDGMLTTFYENGNKSGEAQYRTGRREGLTTTWHENGKKKGEIIYRDGKADGPFATWHQNGTKKMEAIFKDDRAEGVVTSWYENGTKQSVMTYKNGKLDGPGATWHENGQKESEGLFKDNDEVPGAMKTWDESGAPVSTESRDQDERAALMGNVTYEQLIAEPRAYKGTFERKLCCQGLETFFDESRMGAICLWRWGRDENWPGHYRADLDTMVELHLSRPVTKKWVQFTKSEDAYCKYRVNARMSFDGRIWSQRPVFDVREVDLLP